MTKTKLRVLSLILFLGVTHNATAETDDNSICTNLQDNYIEYLESYQNDDHTARKIDALARHLVMFGCVNNGKTEE